MAASTAFILDGGFSTQLATHVDQPIDGDPLWSAKFLATDPDAVLATHLDFLRAGSQIIQTNTYQASVSGFVRHLGLTASEGYKLIGEAVRLAKRAVEIYKLEIVDKPANSVPNPNPLIAGSCGPYGAALHDASEYTGAYCNSVTSPLIMEWHRPRFQALIDAGVDLLALETIPCEMEALALIDLLKQYPSTKAWVAFSCSREDGRSIANGGDFRCAVMRCWERANQGQILAIGVNCLAPQYVTPLITGINAPDREVTVPLVVYPNSGEVYSVEEGWRDKGEAHRLEDFIKQWLDLGARFVGGCCRTGAEDIVKIRTQVDKWSSGRRCTTGATCLSR